VTVKTVSARGRERGVEKKKKRRRNKKEKECNGYRGKGLNLVGIT